MSKKSKGKQRAEDYDSQSERDKEPNGNADNVLDTDDVRGFIVDQIQALQTPLARPKTIDTDRDEAIPSDKAVDKVLSAINTSLHAARKRKLNSAALTAVVDQIEYLRTSSRGKEMIVRLDENAKLYVDRDDWLDDLPPNWPSTTVVKEDGKEVAIKQAKLDEYQRLYKSVQALRQSKHAESQRLDHYAQLQGYFSQALQ